MARPRIVFMGTPEFAVPALEQLAARDDIDLVLVVTQPDRPSGRGKKLTPPPVKAAAVELKLPLLQTDSLRHMEAKERIIAAKPDLVIVAAFGMILGKWILDLPPLGCVNLHASLLPKYRGASPISAAISSGEEMTGVTLMHMDRGLDTGAIYAATFIGIEPDDTTESLTPRLAQAAAELLEARLADLLAGTVIPVPQSDGASETRQLTKDDGLINWHQSAEQIERHVRAMWSWPRAWTVLPDGQRLQIHGASVCDHQQPGIGEVCVDVNQVLVGTGRGTLRLERVQLPGGKPIEGNALAQKFGSWHGGRLHTRP